MSRCHRTPIGLVFALAIAWPLVARAASPPTAADSHNASPTLPAEEIQQIVAPIALYPDVLIAQILPAATFPTDVVMAARWLRSKPDLAQLAQKPWDESVKALCHYPDVLYKMDEDLEWTNALGAAFLDQPADVMNAIQDARERARTDGLLETNEEQTVVDDDDAIRIVPTQADVVYVPQYDPQIVYTDGDYVDYNAAPAISFGSGLALGSWLGMDCNWHAHGVYYCQPGYWRGWPHYGAGHWNGDWVAGVGPRRLFAGDEDRGFYAGPRAAAAWGEHGGAVWKRPATASPRPAYTGRYAGYNSRYGRVRNDYAEINRNLVAGGKSINVNRNNVNIDRGDRTTAYSADRAAAHRGERSVTGGRTFADTGSRADAQRLSERGRESRRSEEVNAARRTTPAPAARASAGERPSPQRQSSFSDARSRSDVQRSSARGQASRGGRAGGGGRRR
jgi:hypothetical protein